MDIVLTMDSTGSMRNVVTEVRKKIKETCAYLFTKIPDLKIGLIVHGDYCDRERCIQKLDLSNDVNVIKRFIDSSENTSGGDAAECYEYVLNQAKTFSWRDGPKALVIVGDERPHYLNYPVQHAHYFHINACLNIDWNIEANDLLKLGIPVYPVYAETGARVKTGFWDQVAKICNTPCLDLKNFADINGILCGVCMSGIGRISEYRDDVVASGEATEGVMGAIRMLMDNEDKFTSVYNPMTEEVSDVASSIKALDTKPKKKTTKTTKTLKRDAKGRFAKV